jgi:DNA-binding MarR family transcriptional regulator
MGNTRDDTARIKVCKVWELWHITNVLMEKHAEDTLAPLGISYPQFLVLFVLNRAGTAATATDLARQLGRNPNALSMILDRMEKNGLVRKVRNLPDRRLVRIAMTKEGREKLAATFEVTQAMIDRLMAPFSGEDLDTFASLISTLQKGTTQDMKRKVPAGAVR